MRQNGQHKTPWIALLALPLLLTVRPSSIQAQVVTVPAAVTVSGTAPSPMDSSVLLFGPWIFDSANFAVTNSSIPFNLGNLLPGTYTLKVQNGNYGPFLSAQCQTITNANLNRQCLYNNLIEQSASLLTRMQSASGNVNSSKINQGKIITSSQSYFEQPVTLTANNSLNMNVQGYPTSALKIGISSMNPRSPPTALFSISAMSGYAPAAISFNGTYSFDSNGGALTYLWNFNDGSSQVTGSMVKHSYSAAGTYAPTLTVTNALGLQSIFSTTILVVKPNTPPSTKPPVLSLAISYPNPNDLLKVHISLSKSYDLQGVITTYNVNFGDGATATGPELDHVYAEDGTYLLQIKLTNDSGLSTSYAENISVSATNNLTSVNTVYGNNTNYASLVGTKTVTDTFQIPAGSLNDIYQLTVKNADGVSHPQMNCAALKSAAYLACQYDNLLQQIYVNTVRVPWATVSINGKTITNSSSISSSSYIFKSFIQLAANNKIVIQFGGVPTAYTQVQIQRMSVASNTPANLSLVAPISTETYANTNPSMIDIVANSDKPIASATINGENAVIIGGTTIFANLLFAKGGVNNIQIAAKDLNGNISTLSRTFNLIFDFAPPVIAFGVASETVVNQISINVPVMVTSSAPATTTVSVNGAEVMSSNLTKFTVPVTLNLNGQNIVTAQSLDTAGNLSAVYSLNIERNAVPVVLSSITPVNGATISGTTVKISGNSNQALSSITVNGQALTLSANALSFSGQISFSNLGAQTLNFQAISAAGNVSKISESIVVQLPILSSWNYQECPTNF